MSRAKSRAKSRAGSCDAGAVVARVLRGLGLAAVMAAGLAASGSIAGAAAAEMSEIDERNPEVFNLFDENRDGFISMAEFQNNKLLVFYVWDRNRDMVLTIGETPLRPEVFARAAGPDGKIDPLEFVEVINESFAIADTNHDSKLDRGEFMAFRRQIRR